MVVPTCPESKHSEEAVSQMQQDDSPNAKLVPSSFLLAAMRKRPWLSTTKKPKSGTRLPKETKHPRSNSLVRKIEHLAIVLKEPIVILVGRMTGSSSPPGGDDNLSVAIPGPLEDPLHSRRR